MEAVKVKVAAAHWLSAVQDVTVRAHRQDREHSVRLRLDAALHTLSLCEEDADSVYQITMPIDTETNTVRHTLTCKLTARKLAPLVEWFAQAQQGAVTITVRKNTLSLKKADQHLLLPSQLIAKPFAETERLFAAKASTDPTQQVRFLIDDLPALRRSLEQCTDTALRVRVGAGPGGGVTVCDHTYPAECRASAIYLWPRGALLDRLSQLPVPSKLYVTLYGQTAVSFSTAEPFAKTGLHREFLIKPYPLTNLYIATNRSTSKSEDSAPWKSIYLPPAPDNKRVKRTPPLRDSQEERENELAELALRPRPERPTDSAAPAPNKSDQPKATAELLTTREMSEQTDGVMTRSASSQAAPPRATALEQLEALPGLAHVKKQIADIAQFAAFEKERFHALGIARQRPTLHMAFLGNPGTGKTIVARLIGRICQELGLLSKGHLVEVDRSALVGAYMGHTEQNLNKYTKRALGGVLFIDEAYTLFKKDSAKDFGLTAINGLVKLLEDHREDLVVIVAGYKKQMNEFFAFNQGLRERIPFHLDFPDYDNDELLAIADYLAKQDHYHLTSEAKDALLKRAQRAKLDDSFSNARTVRNLLEKAKINHAVRSSNRTGEPSTEAYTTLTAADFEAGGLPDAETLDDVLRDLDRLVGLSEVKRLIKRMVAMLALEQQRTAFGLADSPLTLHMSFTGNPGTGKTTVARLIGRLLRVLGLLPKGHFVEASRKDLVAGYMGQTALKTGDKINEALGGILFIDEAYALARSKREEFGAEALATLIKEMEDKKEHLAVIFAGYTKEMEELLKLNPGLKSRIRFHLHFPDYTASDLVEIVKRKAEQSQYVLTEAAEEKLWRYMIRECSLADADFGNGRLAESAFERAKINLSTRLVQTEGEIEKTMLMTLTEDDFHAETGPLA